MDLSTTTVEVPDWFLPSIAALFSNGLPANELRLFPLPGGGNNRVYRLQAGSQAYLVKWYFAATEDPRDRLHSEWEFSNFAWRHGLRQLAEPIACDPSRRIALFEFIVGSRLTATDIDGTRVSAALSFILELNQHREALDAVSLPAASEACFSVAAHIDCVRQRIHRLQAASRGARLSAAACRFIDQLTLAGDRVIAAIQQKQSIDAARQSDQVDLSLEERILSPSDFGFHNALLGADGRLRFLDFEYAGWDDPAKTICDFFSQVAVPVSNEYWSQFALSLESIVPTVAHRAELLRPLYLVKWCCIILNPLLRIGRDRRQFSGGVDCAITESECLDRAQRLLSTIPA
jgi:hypothetical protein